MLIQMGNAAPKNPSIDPELADDPAPRVTYLHVPDTFEDAHGNVHYDFNPKLDVDAFRQHIIDAHSPYLPADRYGITRVGDLGYGNQEALLAITHPNGLWVQQASKEPLWVGSPDDKHGKFTRALADHFGCSHGIPRDVEDTHYTRFGLRTLPPGVSPNALGGDMQMALTNAGRLLQSNMMGGGQVGDTGAGSAATATTLTTGKTYTLNQWAGYRVYVYSTTGTKQVWGNIISNTTGGVLTVDRWYAAATPGGAADTTPSTPWGFIIADGGSTSGWFMGLSATAVGAATATSLSGEITTASGGLVRKISPFANTSSTSPVTWTLTPVFTANGSDSLPVTIITIATFVSMVTSDVTDAMLASSSLSAAATLSASGDQLTVTDTWTGS